MSTNSVSYASMFGWYEKIWRIWDVDKEFKMCKPVLCATQRLGHWKSYCVCDRKDERRRIVHILLGLYSKRV